MSTQLISHVATTSGDTWTTLVTGPAYINSLTLANRATVPSRVSVRLNKGSTTALIIPNDSIPGGGSYRFRLPALVLEAGDRIEVKSVGGVDWTIHGSAEVEE